MRRDEKAPLYLVHADGKEVRCGSISDADVRRFLDEQALDLDALLAGLTAIGRSPRQTQH